MVKFKEIRLRIIWFENHLVLSAWCFTVSSDCCCKCSMETHHFKPLCWTEINVRTMKVSVWTLMLVIVFLMSSLHSDYGSDVITTR